MPISEENIHIVSTNEEVNTFLVYLQTELKDKETVMAGIDSGKR
jgi:hypothetical protein